MSSSDEKSQKSGLPVNPDAPHPDSFFTEGHRILQDKFDTRRLADRLVSHTVSKTFEDWHRSLIAEQPHVWLSTADADGWPDVSYKGGRRGFVKVLSDITLGIPSYDGNGMYRTFGNIATNPQVGLLFCDFEKSKRLRIKGTARLVDDINAVEAFPGAEFIAEVTVSEIFFNCPRYVHKMTIDEISEFAPADGYVPPLPEWKSMDTFADVLPGTDPEAAQ